MQKLFTVSELARRFGVPPRQISDLFYSRRLSDAGCPVVGGRRMIPEEYAATVEAVLRENGFLPAGNGKEPVANEALTTV